MSDRPRSGPRHRLRPMPEDDDREQEPSDPGQDRAGPHCAVGIAAALEAGDGGRECRRSRPQRGPRRARGDGCRLRRRLRRSPRARTARSPQPLPGGPRAAHRGGRWDNATGNGRNIVPGPGRTQRRNRAEGRSSGVRLRGRRAFRRASFRAARRPPDNRSCPGHAGCRRASARSSPRSRGAAFPMRPGEFGGTRSRQPRMPERSRGSQLVRALALGVAGILAVLAVWMGFGWL